MYIIVVGGGKVGFQLAKELAEANHEVLVIEQDAEKAAEITDELGDIVMEGDGCEATVLEKAGTQRWAGAAVNYRRLGLYVVLLRQRTKPFRRHKDIRTFLRDRNFLGDFR